MIKIGSIEYPVGNVWDHKGKTELVQIFISYSGYINFLQFLYIEDGSSVLSERPAGSKLGSKFKAVKLNYPDEFLTSITGSCRYVGWEGYVMTSITFGTNRGSHGPFGLPGENDREFDFQMGQDQPFGGFHGSTNKNGNLESIGVYVKPITIPNNLNSAGEVKKSEPRISHTC